MTSTGRFDGKVVLVTGATSGIGTSASQAFAREGARVVLSGRRTEEGEALTERIRGERGEATFVQADVASEADVVRLVQETVKRYGRLDVAFNGAGVVGQLGPITTLDERVYDEAMNVNLRGMFFALKHEVAQMLEQGRGVIVNATSIASHIGMPGASVYVAGKHGVAGLTKAVALEVAGQGIRVNGVSFGGVDTPMFRTSMGATEESAGYIRSLHPLGLRQD